MSALRKPEHRLKLRKIFGSSAEYFGYAIVLAYHLFAALRSELLGGRSYRSDKPIAYFASKIGCLGTYPIIVASSRG
jgi:hypothetical protein